MAQMYLFDDDRGERMSQLELYEGICDRILERLLVFRGDEPVLPGFMEMARIVEESFPEVRALFEPPGDDLEDCPF